MLVASPPETASAPAASVQLDLADWPTARDCVVVVQTGVRVGAALYETTAQTAFRQTRQRPLAPGGGWVVEVATLDYRQEARNDAEELAGYLAQVKDRLLIEVDRGTGGLLRILNKDELEAKWASLRPKLQTKYRGSVEVTPQTLGQLDAALANRGDYLEEVLRHTPEYQLLFPAVFGRCYSLEVSTPGTAELRQFWGSLNLGLRTEARLAESPSSAGACTVQVVGTVDAERYPAAGVREAVRALTDRFDVDPALALFHHESYVLGPAPYAGVQHAARHTHYEVPGVAGRAVAAVLAPLET